jgi:hypothetical protein
MLIRFADVTEDVTVCVNRAIVPRLQIPDPINFVFQLLELTNLGVADPLHLSDDGKRHGLKAGRGRQAAPVEIKELRVPRK